MKKNTDTTSPFSLTSPAESVISPPTEVTSRVTVQSILSMSAKNDQTLVKYVTEDTDLNRQLTEAGNKLVLIAFLLLGVQPSDDMMMDLITKAKKYQDAVTVLAVDVTKMGELAKKYEASQIPWFTFIKNNNILEGYHSIQIDRVGISIRKHLGLDQANTLRTYIKDGDELNSRLAEAENKLVVLAFLITDDDAGQRLIMELDEIEERENEVDVIKVDIDLCQEIATKYQIQGVPTLIFLKNRMIVDQITGNDTEKIHHAITQLKMPENKFLKVEDKEYVSQEPSGIGVAEPTTKTNYPNK